MRDWEMGAGSRVAKGVAVAVSSSCSICLSQSEIRNAGHVVFWHRVGREAEGAGYSRWWWNLFRQRFNN